MPIIAGPPTRQREYANSYTVVVTFATDEDLDEFGYLRLTGDVLAAIQAIARKLDAWPGVAPAFEGR